MSLQRFGEENTITSQGNIDWQTESSLHLSIVWNMMKTGSILMDMLILPWSGEEGVEMIPF